MRSKLLHFFLIFFISFSSNSSLIYAANSEKTEDDKNSISVNYLKNLPDSDYIIGPGDSLQIIVSREYPELKSQVIIDGEGTIYLPRLKRIFVNGLSLNELNEILNKAYEKFLIPLIIYSPKHIEPKIIRTYGSQIDILSTIVDILDLEATYSSIGTNLLNKKTNYVIVKEGLLTNIISDKGFLQHSIINIVDFKANNTNLNEDYQYVLERKLLAFDHLVYSLVNTNRLNRP